MNPLICILFYFSRIILRVLVETRKKNHYLTQFTRNKNELTRLFSKHSGVFPEHTGVFPEHNGAVVTRITKKIKGEDFHDKVYQEVVTDKNGVKSRKVEVLNMWSREEFLEE